MQMPWKERTVMSERSRFVAQVLSGEETFSAVCRAYGISRKTGYKWMDRAMSGNSMEDLPRTPFHSPNHTPREMEDLILAERGRHPAWGPRKLRRVLLNNEQEDVPSKSTIANILKRNGCVTPEASAASTPYRRFERDRPNELWQMDYKGYFAMLDGKLCYPLTMTDDHSRFCLCLHADTRFNYASFFPVFKRVLEEYGVPSAILCDNGQPWGDSRGGITPFDVWMMRLGVLPTHGRPFHPQTQGKEERFHRTLKQELLSTRPFRDTVDVQAALDAWRQEYNNERPHEALGLDVPAAHYRPSKRTLQEADKPVEYDTGSRLRKVNCKGYLSIRGHRYYITEALIGEYVELSDVDEKTVALRYGEFEFARIDLEQQRIVSRHRRRIRKETEA